MIKELLSRWPVINQIRSGGDGTGPEAMSAHAHSLRPRHASAEIARSVCPYCAVGCGQLVYHKNGKLVSIEGDPASFISRGRLCPKGSDSFELLTHANRATRIKYHRPNSIKWEELDLETAMDMIADRVWDTRERTFVEEEDGKVGRPGGGILALRGHASIQDSTDIPTLYDILPGYLPMPLLGIDADNLADYIAKHRDLTGWWWNFDRYMVSLRS